nr:uncharacterized protein I303_04170 [Kwoniella dejecticola CBS 10117]OBR84849.1 hypothetical protein I303_04170 [Kwoniella dejecticola CBS 10117]
MQGLKDVFIFFVPVVVICLLMCAFIKDLPLDAPALPMLPANKTDGSLPDCIDTTSEENKSIPTAAIPVLQMMEKVRKS